MELSFKNKTIKFKKELSHLDELVLDFSKKIREHTKYVIVSGYLPILFGRSRNTEDIDVLIQPISLKKFKTMWESLTKKYECLNTTNPEQAHEYLKTDSAIRFAKKGEMIPNMEVKTAEDNIEKYVIKNPIQVIVNEQKILISELEVQISYKLFLNSIKDLEDARFLYKLFENKINQQKLKKWLKNMQIPQKRIKKWLGEL